MVPEIADLDTDVAKLGPMGSNLFWQIIWERLRLMHGKMERKGRLKGTICTDEAAGQCTSLTETCEPDGNCLSCPS